MFLANVHRNLLNHGRLEPVGFEASEKCLLLMLHVILCICLHVEEFAAWGKTRVCVSVCLGACVHRCDGCASK